MNGTLYMELFIGLKQDTKAADIPSTSIPMNRYGGRRAILKYSFMQN